MGREIYLVVEAKKETTFTSVYGIYLSVSGKYK